MVHLGPTVCQGYWPDWGTPCLRMLDRDGTCPKAGDPAHGFSGQPDDPRWEWAETTTLSDAKPTWIRGRCRHMTPEPVVTVDPVSEERILVAWLCPDCDEQFDPDRFGANQNDLPASQCWTVWEKTPEPNGFERWAYGGLVLPGGMDVRPVHGDARIFLPGYVVHPGRHRESWLARFAGAYYRANIRVWEYVKESADWIWIPVAVAAYIINMITTGSPWK